MNRESLLLQHVTDILHKNYQVRPDQFILLVYDTRCLLAKLVSTAYQEAISTFAHRGIDFNTIAEDELLRVFAGLPPHSLVILVESLSFRTTKFRLRADLFRLGHQVIEHARLSYNTEGEIDNYIASLQYDTPYYLHAGGEVEQLLAKNSYLRIESEGGHVLTVHSSFEKAIKNTGNFTGNLAASSGFPIGEVFTEATELDRMNGSLVVFGFPTVEHLTYFTEPFTVTIKDGCLVEHTGPAKFEEMMQKIREEEPGSGVQVREIGFGLNRGLDFHHRLTEPTSFERFCGMHYSLGLKHNMYRKKFAKEVVQKYHIDIFCKIQRAFIGDTQIFKNGKYII